MQLQRLRWNNIDDEYFGITTKEEKDKLSKYGVDEAQDHDLHEGDDLQG